MTVNWDTLDSNELKEIKSLTRTFLKKELAPHVLDLDEKGIFPIEIYQKFTKTGLHVVNFPEEYGGLNSIFALNMVGLEMGRIDTGFAMTVLASSQLFGYNVIRLGTKEQKDKYLNALAKEGKIGCWALTEPDVGSNAIGIKTKAKKEGDHYVINGSKTFITNAPIADYFIVLTREFGDKKEGMTAFIIERGQEGVELGKPLKKMGNKTSPTGQIFLNQCRVHESQVLGEPGKAYYDMKQSLDMERLIFGGLVVGMTKEALERSVQYSFERQQFGHPIAKFQLVREMIAEMAARVDLIEMYQENAFRLHAEGKSIHKEATVVKYMGAKLGMEILENALQVHGGNGYMHEYFIEKIYRDVRLFSIGGGTSEIIKLILAKDTYKRILGG